MAILDYFDVPAALGGNRSLRDYHHCWALDDRTIVSYYAGTKGSGTDYIGGFYVMDIKTKTLIYYGRHNVSVGYQNRNRNFTDVRILPTDIASNYVYTNAAGINNLLGIAGPRFTIAGGRFVDTGDPNTSATPYGGTYYINDYFKYGAYRPGSSTYYTWSKDYVAHRIAREKYLQLGMAYSYNSDNRCFMNVFAARYTAPQPDAAPNNEFTVSIPTFWKNPATNDIIQGADGTLTVKDVTPPDDFGYRWEKGTDGEQITFNNPKISVKCTPGPRPANAPAPNYIYVCRVAVMPRDVGDMPATPTGGSADTIEFSPQVQYLRGYNAPTEEGNATGSLNTPPQGTGPWWWWQQNWDAKRDQSYWLRAYGWAYWTDSDTFIWEKPRWWSPDGIETIGFEVMSNYASDDFGSWNSSALSWPGNWSGLNKNYLAAKDYSVSVGDIYIEDMTTDFKSWPERGGSETFEGTPSDEYAPHRGIPDDSRYTTTSTAKLTEPFVHEGYMYAWTTTVNRKFLILKVNLEGPLEPRGEVVDELPDFFDEYETTRVAMVACGYLGESQQFPWEGYRRGQPGVFYNLEQSGYFSIGGFEAEEQYGFITPRSGGGLANKWEERPADAANRNSMFEQYSLEGKFMQSYKIADTTAGEWVYEFFRLPYCLGLDDLQPDVPIRAAEVFWYTSYPAGRSGVVLFDPVDRAVVGVIPLKMNQREDGLGIMGGPGRQGYLGHSGGWSSRIDGGAW